MLITIDFASDIPIYVQLRDQIIIGIAKGELALGEALPSVRSMAAEIGVHAHTVNKAYSTLKEEGFIIIDRRSGCHVAPIIPKSDNSFTDSLRDKLQPILAAATCRHMKLEEFIDLCNKIMVDFKEETLDHQ